MPRKVAQTYKWKLEGHRKSPRISAMEACKSQQPKRPINGMAGVHQPQPGSRARKRRKLKPLEDVASKSVKAGEEESHECPQSHSGQLISIPSTTCKPDKRILELIIDILQRRDTHEIFAEPVDPEEIEGYYEIIKEPMDFGTMRAKLHDRMYSSFEQFERDVFLIPRNAMQFNSSATIYFRQARAIHELAKRVFHSLKTDPVGFQSEILRTRRRSNRRLQGKATGSLNSSSMKLPENLKSSSTIVDESAKAMSGSISVSSNLWKGVKLDPMGSSSSAPYNYEIFSGGRHGGGSSSSEVDPRSTYRPWISFLNEDESIDSKQLMPVRWTDITYKESLMLFTKDLGPTAQKIAERKLCGWPANASQSLTLCSNYLSQDQRCQDPYASTSAHPRPSTVDAATIITTSDDFPDPNLMLGITGLDMSLCKADRGVETCNGDIICCSSAEAASTIDVSKTLGTLRREVHFTDTNSLANKICWHEGSQLGSYSSSLGARNLNFSDGGFQNTINISTRMILDESKSQDDAPPFWKSVPNQAHQSKVSLSGSRSSENISSSLRSAPSFYKSKGSVQHLKAWCLNDQPKTVVYGRQVKPQD